MAIAKNTLRAIAKNSLRQGQWAEALFVARATTEGLNVSKPWGAYRYDFLVERDGHTWRVQVKSCRKRRRKRSYLCTYQGKNQRPYTGGEFDFFAIYLIPEQVWYVLPFASIAHLAGNLLLSPGYPNSKYHRYLEAWHLLRSPGRQKAAEIKTALSSRAGA